MGSWQETRDIARDLARSVRGSRTQTAAALAALALPALTSPVMAVASGALGAAILAGRFRGRRDPIQECNSGVPHLGIPAGDSMRIPLGIDADGDVSNLNRDDLCQHVLMLGTPSPDKTRVLLGLAQGVLAEGGGFLFMEAKGASGLPYMVAGLASMAGRGDDVLHLDLSTEDGSSPHGFNPFASADAGSIHAILYDLIGSSLADKAWQDRGWEWLSVLSQGLAWLRDGALPEDRVALDPRTISRLLDLGTLTRFLDGTFGDGVPLGVRNGAEIYLTGLVGYRRDRGTEQAQSVLDAHAYLEGRLRTSLLAMAPGTGGPLASPRPEIDMDDVLTGRRILVVTLPRAESGSVPVSHAGRLVLATIKDTFTRGLAAMNERDASGGEGPVASIRSRGPFLAVLDDVDAYMTLGFSLTAARARGLGIAVVHSAPDIPSLTRAQPPEAASTIACTSTKAFVASDDIGRYASELGEVMPWLARDARAGGLMRRARLVPGASGPTMLVSYKDQLLMLSPTMPRLPEGAPPQPLPDLLVRGLPRARH